jgi:hypothetical protein
LIVCGSRDMPYGFQLPALLEKNEGKSGEERTACNP